MSSLSSVPAASPSKGDALVGSVGLPVDAAVVDRATDWGRVPDHPCHGSGRRL